MGRVLLLLGVIALLTYAGSITASWEFEHVGGVDLAQMDQPPCEMKPPISPSLVVNISREAASSIEETGVAHFLTPPFDNLIVTGAVVTTALIVIVIISTVVKRRHTKEVEARHLAEGEESTRRSIASNGNVTATFKPAEIEEEALNVYADRTAILTPSQAEFSLAPQPPQSQATGIPRAVLVVGNTGFEIPLQDDNVFGRPDFSTYIVGYRLGYISTRHFRIYKMGGEWYVEDLGSTNGTFLNGVDIRGKGPQKLKNGDIISVANEIDFIFKIS